jgi:two-component system response regulator GlrR
MMQEHLLHTHTKTISRNSERSVRGVVVRVLGAPPGSGFRLSQGTCVVGSSSSCDVVITDPTVSRTHLELAVVGDGIAVSDLGSRNGTYYCGQRIEKIVLDPRAVLTLGSARLSIEPDMLLNAEPYVSAAYRGLIGGSPAMRELFSLLAQLEGSPVSVHVTGESGVGKEVVARALHEGSGVNGPLVTINCGAIERSLVASELFGHKRGAFTGAVEARKGAFETANGGTLFLDEIGELPLDVQPVLLRVLESGEVRPVGGDRTEKVSVRVISATHRNLEGAVAEGRFREDLYYRLAVIKVHVPPLRERPDDIELLAREFARTAGVDLTPEALTELRRRAWAGNVRELRNVVQAYAVLRSLPAASSHRDPRTEEALERFIRGIDVTRSYADLKDDLLERFQHVYLAQLIARTCGNQTAAAKLSGLDRTYLGRLLAKYRLTK